MFIKSILTAAIFTSSAFALHSAALASDSSVVRDHRTKVVVRDHRTKPVVRDHRTKIVVRDHRNERRNEVVRVKRVKLNCRNGYEALWWDGYRSIQTIDCKGKFYDYRAIKNDMFFKVNLNSYSGEIKTTLLGFAH